MWYILNGILFIFWINLLNWHSRKAEKKKQEMQNGEKSLFHFEFDQYKMSHTMSTIRYLQRRKVWAQATDPDSMGFTCSTQDQLNDSYSSVMEVYKRLFFTATHIYVHIKNSHLSMCSAAASLIAVWESSRLSSSGFWLNKCSWRVPRSIA